MFSFKNATPRHTLSLTDDSENMLSAILKSSPAGIVCIDTDSVVTEWSTVCETLFGWHRSEAVNRQLCDLIIPERYHAAHKSGMRRYLSTLCSDIVGSKTLPLQARMKNGSEMPVRLTLSVCRINKNGKSMKHSPPEIIFIGFIEDARREVTIIEDLEDTKQAEDTFLQFLSNIPASVAVLNAQLQCIFENDTFKQYKKDRTMLEVYDELSIRDLINDTVVQDACKLVYVSRLHRFYEVHVICVTASDKPLKMIYMMDETEKTHASRKVHDLIVRSLTTSGEFAQQTEFLTDLVRAVQNSLEVILENTLHHHDETAQCARRLAAITDMAERIVYLEQHPPLKHELVFSITNKLYDRYTHALKLRSCSFEIETDLRMGEDMTVPEGVLLILRNMLDYCLNASSEQRTIRLNVHQRQSECVTFCVYDSIALQKLHFKHPFTWNGNNELYISHRIARMINSTIEVEHTNEGVALSLAVPQSVTAQSDGISSDNSLWQKTKRMSHCSSQRSISSQENSSETVLS